MAETPDIRIGETERERAMRELSDHFSAGRLSVAEFDERSQLIAAATTRAALAPVFADLPGLQSELSNTETSRIDHWLDWRMAIVIATPIVVLALMFLLGSWTPLLLLPVVAVGMYLADKRRLR